MIAIAFAAAILGQQLTGDDPVTPAGDAIDISAVNAILSRVQPDVPVDPFAEPIRSDLIGRRLLLSFQFAQRGQETSTASWAYDAQSQRLTLTASSEPYTSFRAAEGQSINGRVEIAGFRTQYRTTSRRSERMENAFGATAAVEVVHDRILGVAVVEPGDLPNGGQYSVVVDMPREQARSLVGNLRFEVDAAVRDFGGGQAVLCGTRYFGPTLDGPREIFTDICVLSIDAKAVRIRDASSGAVIKEWASLAPLPSGEALTAGGIWDPGAIPSFRRPLDSAGSGWAEVRCEVIGNSIIYRCDTMRESGDGWGSAAKAGLRAATIKRPTGSISIRVDWPTEGPAITSLLASE